MKREDEDERFLEKYFPYRWVLLNRENVERLNLVPAVYELGVKDPYDRKPTPVYVGETCNVYERMMDYLKGDRFRRLQNGCCQWRFCHLDYEITEVLGSKGSIWYRYTEKESKSVAKEIERDLLREYDYAWNIASNK
jgi:hypothetical protein